MPLRILEFESILLDSILSYTMEIYTIYGGREWTTYNATTTTANASPEEGGSEGGFSI